LGIPRSTVYYKAQISLDETELCNKIYEVYLEWPYYGYLKITAVLRHEGVAINHKRVHRIMKSMGLVAIYPGPRTSLGDPKSSIYPYLLKGLEIILPNQVWAVDITYIRLPTGMVYLFALIDWDSRFIVAWTLASSMTADHGVETLQKALVFGVPDICNADQGSQFTGAEWIRLLLNLNIQISHDGVGRCIDNVRIERFWRTIKYEDVHLKQYQTIKEARKGLGQFINHYNYQRPHQALDYERPADIYFAGKQIGALPSQQYKEVLLQRGVLEFAFRPLLLPTASTAPSQLS
jgi:putative transposase